MPKNQPGPERKDDRQVISLRGPSVPASCRCSPPAAAGATAQPRTAVYDRFNRWSRRGFWLMWQMGGFGPMPGQVHHFLGVAEADRAYGLDRYQTETHRLYGVLDRRLAGVEYVADALSVADFAILGWAWRHERHRVDLAAYPNVRRWYEALMARPGVKRGFDVALR